MPKRELSADHSPRAQHALRAEPRGVLVMIEVTRFTISDAGRRVVAGKAAA